jgi:peptidoglycan/LPS O-acetylase OafA/YrhL
VESIGGYMWLIITVIMVAVLAAAILWGTHQWRQRRRGPRAERRSDEAVKRVYREEDSKS